MTGDNVTALPCFLCSASENGRCDLSWYMYGIEEPALPCPYRTGEAHVPHDMAQTVRSAVEIGRGSPYIAEALAQDLPVPMDEDPDDDET